MPMEMLRILIFPKVCDHATGPMLIYHAGSNLTNHLKQLEPKVWCFAGLCDPSFVSHNCFPEKSNASTAS